jgi:hypothetical protein
MSNARNTQEFGSQNSGDLSTGHVVEVNQGHPVLPAQAVISESLGNRDESNPVKAAEEAESLTQEPQPKHWDRRYLPVNPVVYPRELGDIMVADAVKLFSEIFHRLSCHKHRLELPLVDSPKQMTKTVNGPAKCRSVVQNQDRYRLFIGRQSPERRRVKTGKLSALPVEALSLSRTLIITRSQHIESIVQNRSAEARKDLDYLFGSSVCPRFSFKLRFPQWGLSIHERNSLARATAIPQSANIGGAVEKPPGKFLNPGSGVRHAIIRNLSRNLNKSAVISIAEQPAPKPFDILADSRR